MIPRNRLAILCGIAAVVSLIPARPGAAQGCICARQSQPVFGPNSSPYLKKGEWLFSSTYRYNHSKVLFSGSEAVLVAPKVSRTQHLLDLSGTIPLSEQTTLSLTVPFADLKFGLGMPPGTDPDRTHVGGLGDVNVICRHYLMGTTKHPNENVSAGIGLKFPTGRHDARDAFRNGAGVRDVRAVDISTQLGDGGWGILFDLQAFKRMKDVTLFFSGTYLVNPEDTNGTPSLPFGLMGAGAPPNARVNSIPDQYVARFGAAMPVKAMKGLGFSLAGRLEGVPTSDLIGSDNGFRFAGYAFFVEPGLTYSRGRDTFSLSIPIRVAKEIQSIASTPGPDMGTVVPYSVIVNYSHRFGK